MEICSILSEFWHLLIFLFSLSLILFIVLLIYIVRAGITIKELFVSRKMLVLLNENNPGTIVKFNNNSERTVTFISKNVFTLTGYKKSEILYNKHISFNDLVLPDDRINITKAIQQCNLHNKYYKVEYQIITEAKKVKWILEHGICYFNRHNELLRVAGMLTDITDLKYTEYILSESEKRFQLLIDNAPIGICISYENLITYANPVFTKMFGFSDQIDLLGAHLEKCIQSPEKNKIEELLKKYQLDISSDLGYNTMGVHKDGTLFPLQIFVNQVKLGNYESTLTFVHDITEHKQTINDLISLNQRLNDIIELIPDPTLIIDKNKSVTHWNKAIEELTRVTKEDILGKDVSNCSIPFYGKKVPMLIELVDEEIAANEAQYDNIKKSITKSQNKIYGDFSGALLNKEFVHLWGVAAPLFDYEGNRFGSIEVIKDITESKRKENALIKSELKSRVILDSNQDIILLINTDKIILDCNLSFALTTGKSREELIGTNIALYYTRNPVWNSYEYARKAIETGEIQVFDIDYENSDYFTVRLHPIKDENNKISSLVLYVQNITKLKNAEQALRNSEEEYRTITESITDYLYKVIYKNGKVSFLFKNSGIEKIIGYEISDFKVNPNLFYNIIVEEDKEIMHSFLNKAFEYRENVTFEHKVTHKNGETIWLSNSLIFKESADNIIELNGVIKDISLSKKFEMVLKDAEERYRSVFDQSGLISNVYDLDGTLIMQNSFAAKIMGGDTSDFLYKNITELYTADISRVIRNIINATIINNDLLLDEREFAFATGKYWLKTTSHTIKNAKGDVIGVQFISQDVTDKKDWERSLLNTIIETEEKERIHFAQELHDGLGPIISAVKMYVQWLSRPDSKISQSEILKDTEQLIDEAGETIRELSFKLSPHILNNFGLIEALKTFTQKVNQSKKLVIQFDYNFTNRFEETVETVIYRILCECINNTIKHANASQVTIKILKFISKIRITYTDNGNGFDTNQMSIQKSGNGLFNMQSRLHSINGSLIIKSQLGKGVKIMISIQLDTLKIKSSLN